MKILEKLGLSDKEAKTYQALLKIRGATVMELNKIVGLKRPTVYFCLNRLMEKGLVAQGFAKTKKVYFATPPDSLLELLHRQQSALSNIEGRLAKVVAKLKDITQNKEIADSLDVKIYEGMSSLEKLADKLLLSHQDFLFIYSGQSVLKHVSPEQLREKFTKRRRQIHSSKLYAIGDLNPFSKQRLREADTDFREIRIVPEPIHFKAILCVCGSQVILVSLDGTPKAIVIDNKAIAQILSFLFWSLWESL
ncbi:MAG: helix-turn-helix domain-containing protein [Candidatus Pacebacteria bacterium]|nr:helix-turn-helix domain-containing protein [Candidatus Paceibacterota bacterium]